METLHSMINRNLAEYEQLYDIVPNKDDSYSTRLTAIIQEAHKQTGEQVVVLIDEYDAISKKTYIQSY